MKWNLNRGLRTKMEAVFIHLKYLVNWDGKQKYLKEVDAEEIIIKFWQEVYDENDILREIHEKYPIDKGHKKI